MPILPIAPAAAGRAGGAPATTPFGLLNQLAADFTGRLGRVDETKKAKLGAFLRSQPLTLLVEAYALAAKSGQLPLIRDEIARRVGASSRSIEECSGKGWNLVANVWDTMFDSALTRKVRPEAKDAFARSLSTCLPSEFLAAFEIAQQRGQQYLEEPMMRELLRRVEQGPDIAWSSNVNQAINQATTSYSLKNRGWRGFGELPWVKELLATFPPAQEIALSCSSSALGSVDAQLGALLEQVGDERFPALRSYFVGKLALEELSCSGNGAAARACDKRLALRHIVDALAQEAARRAS